MKHARKDYDRIQDPANLIPEDEPVFLLRAKDKTAPKIVEMWADLAEHEGADRNIVERARSHARFMRAYQQQHGCQIPDMPTE
jgi:hypothetical protein